MSSLYSQWMEAFESVDIHPISDETCCKILAIVYVYGGSMEFIYNTKLMRDIEYCKKRVHIGGAETPDADMVVRIKELVARLEQDIKNAPHNEDSESPLSIIHPEWVTSLMSGRYGITKMWI